MRSMLSILLAIFLLIHAGGQAQSITLSGKNLPLVKVFAAIEQQTGYVVFYNYTLIKNAKPVTLNAKATPLEQFLKMCFVGQSLKYVIEGKTIMVTKKNADKVLVDFTSTANSSDTVKKVNIKGKVINEKGDPVIATVTLKGTTNSVSTNTNGEFVLKGMSENVMLVISGVNIEPSELKINTSSDLKIITVKTKIKEEETVVVANTGYQKLKPNEITGSVVVIDNKTLNQQTGTNIIDRLNGVTPGMLFNVGKNKADGTPNPYLIRGLSTINGNTSPLIILDNFQYDGDINNINPGDVENITVLKDAAAASIYGALGGNGVIVITTKRGRFNQKVKVEFNTDVIVTQKPDLYAIPQLSSSEYIYLEEFFFNKGFSFSDNFETSPLYSVTPVISILKKRRAGIISEVDSSNQIDALKKIDSRNDLNKYFYQNAITRQYSLNLHGGSNNLAWLLSGSYDKGISNLDDKADKINLKLLNEYKPLKNLNISFSAYYTNASSESGKLLPTTLRNEPYIRFADEEGVPLAMRTIINQKFADTAGAGHLLNWAYAPLEEYKHDKTTSRREQLIAGIEARYLLLKGLDLSINYQYQREWGNAERYMDMESYHTRITINTFTRLSRSSAPDTFYVPKGGIAEISTKSEHSQNLRMQLGFQKNWYQHKHAINAIIAVEKRESIIDPINQYTLYGYNKDPLTQAKVNYDIAYRDFFGGSSYIQGAPFVGPLLTSRFMSLLGNATYTFKRRYSISASARRDAANVFGASTNNKWTPLWSTGVAWDMSAEPFYHFMPLPYLKWRFTYGYSGNVDLSKTALMVIRYSGDNTTPYGLPYADPTRRNADLRWEKKRDFNIAMEFATKGRTISGSIEYYEKNCTDLYGQTLYDYTTQYTFEGTIQANIANTKGNGLDITINTRNLDKAIKWNTNLIFNYSRDIVTEYFSPSAQSGSGLIGNDGGINIIPVIGKPLYAIAAYKWGGLDAAGDPRGYVYDTVTKIYNILSAETNKGVNSTSINYIGPSTPPFFGSLINDISWKGFSVNINLLYSFGYYFRKPTFSQNSWMLNGTGYGDFSRRWQKPGDELFTTVPSLTYPVNLQRESFYAKSTVNVLKADHIRLHYINFSYSFTRGQQRFPFSAVQVYMNIANLGIVWRSNKEKIDPLYPNSIPPSKSFTLGVRASL